MKNKLFSFLSIVSISIFFVSCTSTTSYLSSISIKPFYISNSLDKEILSQKTIFVDIKMLDMNFPSKITIPNTIYKDEIKDLIPELEKIQYHRLEKINNNYFNKYQKKYSAQMIRLDSFLEDKINFIYFFSTDKHIKKQIADICERYNAELLITNVCVINIIEPNYIFDNKLDVYASFNISMEINIFNKLGKLLTNIVINTPIIYDKKSDQFLTSFEKLFNNLDSLIKKKTSMISK